MNKNLLKCYYHPNIVAITNCSLCHKLLCAKDKKTVFSSKVNIDNSNLPASQTYCPDCKFRIDLDHKKQKISIYIIIFSILSCGYFYIYTIEQILFNFLSTQNNFYYFMVVISLTTYLPILLVCYHYYSKRKFSIHEWLNHNSTAKNMTATDSSNLVPVFSNYIADAHAIKEIFSTPENLVLLNSSSETEKADQKEKKFIFCRERATTFESRFCSEKNQEIYRIISKNGKFYELTNLAIKLLGVSLIFLRDILLIIIIYRAFGDSNIADILTFIGMVVMIMPYEIILYDLIKGKKFVILDTYGRTVGILKEKWSGHSWICVDPSKNNKPIRLYYRKKKGSIVQAESSFFIKEHKIVKNIFGQEKIIVEFEIASVKDLNFNIRVMESDCTLLIVFMFGIAIIQNHYIEHNTIAVRSVFCYICGAPVLPGDQYCMNCGKKLRI